MIRKFIPGVLALSLVATLSAKPAAKSEAAKTPAAKSEATTAPAASPAKAEATTPPIEVPAKPKLDPAVIKTDSSYALGFRTGSTFSQQFGRFGVTADDIEQANFINGFMAAVKGGKPELSEEKLQAAMQALGEMLQGREKEAATANLEAGTKFLEENAKRKEVTTTKSGLQYEVLAKGGDEKYVAPKEDPKADPKAAPKDNKQFMVNYKGTLLSGKQFDASPEGAPVAMTLQVVDGFKEALTTMPVGAKWKLFLPAKLAYGEQRRSADIGPNCLLIFEIELVKIQDAPAAPEGGMPFPMPQGGGAPQE
ncbi:MAG: FKBP-type peptidyl-prolyl cis-trans isomerase N-terminal domain-containing protein [Verrucomicrobiota bacterium]